MNPNNNNQWFCGTFCGEGRPGWKDSSQEISMFNTPSALLVLDDESVIISDVQNHVLRKVNLRDGSVKTIVFSQYQNKFIPKLLWPRGLCSLTKNSFLVCDYGHNTIVRVWIEDNKYYAETYAGAGKAGFRDGSFETAEFYGPVSICKGPERTNSFFVCDKNNDKIRLLKDNFVSTVAGSKQGYLNGPSKTSCLNSPTSICLNPIDESILFCDTGNHCIRRISPNLDFVDTFAGSPTGTNGYIDGEALLSAKFSEPCSIIVAPDGLSFLVCDKINNCIRRIICSLNNNNQEINDFNHKSISNNNNSSQYNLLYKMVRVTTFCGKKKGGWVNGVLSEALFSLPTASIYLPRHHYENLHHTFLIADSRNHCIRIVYNLNHSFDSNSSNLLPFFHPYKDNPLLLNQVNLNLEQENDNNHFQNKKESPIKSPKSYLSSKNSPSKITFFPSKTFSEKKYFTPSKSFVEFSKKEEKSTEKKIKNSSSPILDYKEQRKTFISNKNLKEKNNFFVDKKNQENISEINLKDLLEEEEKNENSKEEIENLKEEEDIVDLEEQEEEDIDFEEEENENLNKEIENFNSENIDLENLKEEEKIEKNLNFQEENNKNFSLVLKNRKVSFDQKIFLKKENDLFSPSKLNGNLSEKIEFPFEENFNFNENLKETIPQLFLSLYNTLNLLKNQGQITEQIFEILLTSFELEFSFQMIGIKESQELKEILNLNPNSKFDSNFSSFFHFFKSQIQKFVQKLISMEISIFNKISTVSDYYFILRRVLRKNQLFVETFVQDFHRGKFLCYSNEKKAFLTQNRSKLIFTLNIVDKFSLFWLYREVEIEIFQMKLNQREKVFIERIYFDDFQQILVVEFSFQIESKESLIDLIKIPFLLKIQSPRPLDENQFENDHENQEEEKEEKNQIKVDFFSYRGIAEKKEEKKTFKKEKILQQAEFFLNFINFQNFQDLQNEEMKEFKKTENLFQSSTIFEKKSKFHLNSIAIEEEKKIKEEKEEKMKSISFEQMYLYSQRNLIEFFY